MMALLKSFFKPYLDHPYQAISADSPESYHILDKLAGLPSELLIKICDLLSPVDKVCFCLCNRRLYALFKRYYQFPTLRDDRLSILFRLERDSSALEYFACDICNILHRYDGSESFGLSGLCHKKSSQLPCIRKGYDWRADCIGGSSISMRSHRGFDHARNRITFVQIKLAMRRYCYGPQFGINTDSLAFTQVCRYAHPWQDQLTREEFLLYGPTTVLFSIDAQICSEPLGVHIRMQDIIVYDIWEDSKIRVNSKAPIMSDFEICRHVSLLSKASDIDSVYRGTRTSFPYTCPRCNTVALIEFRRVGSRLGLIMTRWINLGPGVDREDPLWKVHIYTCIDGAMPDELPSSLMLPSQSPRTCFENASPLSFEELRSRNISYLRDDRYRKWGPFDFDDRGLLWHISYKEPFKPWRYIFRT